MRCTPVSFTVASLALRQLCDYSNAETVIPEDIGEINHRLTKNMKVQPSMRSPKYVKPGVKKLNFLNIIGFVMDYNSVFCGIQKSTIYSTISFSIVKARPLTHSGLVTSYGDKDLGQHWLRLWPAAWRHQAIAWTNVDWSTVNSSDIHNRVISQEMPQPSIT